MLGVLADDHDSAFSFDDFAFIANLFNGRSYFHFCTVPLSVLFQAAGYASLRQVIDRNFDGHLVAR